MNTKILMAVSAVLMGIAGIILSFFPEEILGYMAIESMQPVLLQLLGALYLSFAILNWMAKANLIGGIYSKPVALGNFSHFAIGGLSLAKADFSSGFPAYTLATTIIYLLFAVLFGYVLFVGPSFKTKAAA
ncbi:hypothetical protein [uncultured Pontibacter sp.]|uniref:hypothetical protein n=1 Tax=uncultured Pontibacter sp. TaxID=453356 RepID=UPI0026168B2E|nr:hypothetical protein [uncultured Pontibacter sp.]